MALYPIYDRAAASTKCRSGGSVFFLFVPMAPPWALSAFAIVCTTCAGVGVTFLYQPVVQQELQQGLLREIPLEEDPFCHDFTFLWRRGSAFAGEYRAMFQLLRQ